MTALMDAVAAALVTPDRMYPLNGVPKLPDYPYGSYSAVLGRGDSYTLDARSGLRWGRVTVQTFGHDAGTALDLMDQVTADLLDVALDVDGYKCGPLRFGLEPVVVRNPSDEGVVEVTASFNFTAVETDEES